jgi:rRNA maturation endonuclease Nob1
MFKKKCKRCGKTISRGFDFCPFCGDRTKEIKDSFFKQIGLENEKEDYGFLGKEDSIDLSDLGMNIPLGGIFNSLMKEFDKQFKQLDKSMKNDNKNIIKGNGISISISTEPGKPPKISVNDLRNIKQKENSLITEQIPRKNIEITEKDVNKMAKLPREEAETKVRRLSNKIIYEISLPGVKNIKNIFVNKLENSIEIKAFSKDKVYFKLIPINLPILNYKLKEEKLLLELAEKL